MVHAGERSMNSLLIAEFLAEFWGIFFNQITDV